MGYAVIDLETTGFSPARGDRIVEVGVVLLDDAGRIEGEWTTLVNPLRDVGATHVHGIRATDVTDAPVFAEIAAHLVDLLRGRSIVAHNQAFDMRFLRAELQANDFILPATYAALCTMLWARASIGASKLSDVCAALEIENTSVHAALGDARATAQVLTVLMQLVGHQANWHTDVAASRFPSGLVSRAHAPVTYAAQPRTVVDTPMVFVDTAALPLWERVSIPLDPGDAAASVYLDMLTRVLEDGLISTAEYSRLEAITEVAHLSPERVTTLHSDYLRAARAEAIADGLVSEAERRELTQIATILDLPIPDPLMAPSSLTPPPDHSLTATPAPAPAPSPKLRPTGAQIAPGPTGATFELVPGARIVFTGTLSRPREDWVHAIAEAGFVTGSVTKSCVVLIAEDPASQSGKAKTARNHGIPIVTEAEFAPAFEAYLARKLTRSALN